MPGGVWVIFAQSAAASHLLFAPVDMEASESDCLAFVCAETATLALVTADVPAMLLRCTDDAGDEPP